MISSTKNDIHLLKRDALRLGNEEVNKDGEKDVDRHEKEETLQTFSGEECREELLENGVGNVLTLRCHTNSLGSDVGGEDFAGPHPGSGAPGWLVEETGEELEILETMHSLE